MSIPPPSSARTVPPGGTPADAAGESDRRSEIRLELAPARGRRNQAGLLHLLGAELTIVQPGVLREPLVLTGGLIEVAAVERSAARDGEHGRFPVLRRVSEGTVLPFEHGIEGWVWTTRNGSALPALGETADAPPNLALSFVRPLADDVVERCFEPEWVRVLADRSPLGSPSIPGLLLTAADPSAAADAFRRFGVLGPLTDREIPPSMRRHLPGDKPANPRVATSDATRARTSVAPPGMS